MLPDARSGTESRASGDSLGRMTPPVASRGTSPRRLVFIGDSITDAGRDRADDSSLGEGYVRLIAEALAARGEDVTVLNRGISGDRVVDLERRWESDAVAPRPDILSVYVGVNDMWRRYDSDDPTPVADYEARYRSLLDRSLAAGPVHLILVEPFFLPTTDAQRGWLDDLDPKRAAVARIAAEYGAGLVALHDAATRAAVEHGIPAIAPDGVHPAPQGSELIASAWLRVYDAGR
jgi:acyl-CoA thioesterase-1